MLQLQGALNHHSAQEFAKVIEQLLEESRHHIVLDCTNLQHISDHGFAAFFQAQEAITENNGQLLLVQANAEVSGMLTLLNICSETSFAPTLDVAEQRMMLKS